MGKKSKTNCESWGSMLDRSMPSMSTTTDLMKRPSSVRIGLVIRLVVTTTNATWNSKFSTTTTLGRRTTIGLTNGWRSWEERARGSSASPIPSTLRTGASPSCSTNTTTPINSYEQTTTRTTNNNNNNNNNNPYQFL